VCSIGWADFATSTKVKGGIGGAIRENLEEKNIQGLNLSPHLTPNPGFNPVLTPFYITNVRGEPRVKPGVWRPNILALKSKASKLVTHSDNSIFVVTRLFVSFAI
jgi:hypothetical protein